MALEKVNKPKSLFSTRGNCNCWLIQETKRKRRVRHTEIVTIYLVCLDGLNEQSFPPQGASGFSFDHSTEVVTSMGRGGGKGFWHGFFASLWAAKGYIYATRNLKMMAHFHYQLLQCMFPCVTHPRNDSYILSGNDLCSSADYSAQFTLICPLWCPFAKNVARITA